MGIKSTTTVSCETQMKVPYNCYAPTVIRLFLLPLRQLQELIIMNIENEKAAMLIVNKRKGFFCFILAAIFCAVMISVAFKGKGGEGMRLRSPR